MPVTQADLDLKQVGPPEIHRGEVGPNETGRTWVYIHDPTVKRD